MFRKYYNNRHIFKCPECGRYFAQSFWEWAWGSFRNDNTRNFHVKCPYCKLNYFLRGVKTTK